MERKDLVCQTWHYWQRDVVECGGNFKILYVKQRHDIAPRASGLMSGRWSDLCGTLRRYLWSCHLRCDIANHSDKLTVMAINSYKWTYTVIPITKVRYITISPFISVKGHHFIMALEPSFPMQKTHTSSVASTHARILAFWTSFR